MLYATVAKPEVHERIPVEDVDVTQYEPLIHKIVRGYAKTYGPVITDHYEDYVSAGSIAVIQAKNVYDPTRGTFVTIAFRKIFSAVNKMFVKYSKDYRAMDLRKLDSESEDSSDPCRDGSQFVESYRGSNINYEAVGRLLPPELGQLYALLFLGKTRGFICRTLGIPWNQYDTYISLLKEELREIVSTLYGS